jgi:hypothetical protein
MASALPIVAATALAALFSTIAADLRWAAALGAYVVRHGSIPGFVPYATAPSHGWHDAPVLGELVLHAFDSVGGARALGVAQVLAVAAAFLLLRLDMHGAGASSAGAQLALMLELGAAFASLVVVRASLFSLVLFPLLLLLLRREARAPSWRLWLVPCLLALWANLHGTVLVGAAVAGAYLVAGRFPREPATAVGVLAVSILALFATPAFWNSGSYYAGVLRNEAARRGVGQWTRLSLHSPFDVLFLVTGVALLLLAIRGGQHRRWELLALAGLAVLVSRSARGEFWLAFFLATPAAAGIPRSRDPRRPEPRTDGNRSPESVTEARTRRGRRLSDPRGGRARGTGRARRRKNLDRKSSRRFPPRRPAPLSRLARGTAEGRLRASPCVPRRACASGRPRAEAARARPGVPRNRPRRRGRAVSPSPEQLSFRPNSYALRLVSRRLSS